MLDWQRLNFLNILRSNSFNHFLFASFLLHILFFFIFFYVQQTCNVLEFTINKHASEAIIKVLPLTQSKIKKKVFKNQTTHKTTQKKSKKNPKTALQKDSKKKQVQTKTSEINKKKISKKIESQKELIPKDIPVTQTPTIPSEIPKTEPDEIVYVTQKEFDILRVQQNVQETIAHAWSPPMGIPEDSVYEVLITIGWDGAILEQEVIKKTGILLYDLSVQKAIDQTIFPNELQGKKLTLSFKP